MKRALTTIAATIAVCANLAAQPSESMKAMDGAVEKFLGSKEVLTKSTGWSHGMDEYYFKYTMTDNGQPISQTDIEQLADAFKQHVGASSAAYSYDYATSQRLPFTNVIYRRADNYFSSIYGTYSFDDEKNFRIVNFIDDQKLTSYGMKWHETQFTDRDGRPFRTIDGQVFKFYDGIWEMNPESYFYTGNAQANSSQAIPVGQNDHERYEVLHRQVSSLNRLYAEARQKGDEKTCDALAYVLKKVCKEFDGWLTKEQFAELQEEVGLTYMMDAIDTERRNVIESALTALSLRSERMRTTRVTYASKPDAAQAFVKPDDVRLLWKNYTFDDAERPQVRVSLTGTASANSTFITIQKVHPNQRPYAVAVNDGKFVYDGAFDKDQLLEITDEQGNRMVIIADSTPTEIDLLKQTLSGSRQNERFAECQRRLSALKRETQKFAAPDGTVVDDEGYNRLIDDAHALRLKMVEENQDNLIPAWYLAENYFAMSLNELEPFMQRYRAYAAHVAMQPVWQHYEGLKKRTVGKAFIDGETVDTTGVVHRLSEYIGQGNYTILCFWNMQSRQDMKTLKGLQQKYKGSPLTIVAVTLDTNREEWAKYVRQRDLQFVHLQPTDIEGKEYPYGWESELFSDYGITTTLPETIIFSPDGHIVAHGLCGETLKSTINQLGLASLVSK